MGTTEEIEQRRPAPRTAARKPVGVDTSRPSIARVYDLSLGGKDNYDVDRVAYEQILQIAPRQGDVSIMNRRWLHRVVRYLAGAGGVDQFLDIGAGLPTVANTHEVAQMVNPDARVVYVDNDPVCSAHGRVLLEQNENTRFVAGDIVEDGTLLENKEIRRFLDTDRPIGLLVVGLLHHLDDDLDPAGLMHQYVERLPPGSFLAVSAFWDPANEDPELHGLAGALQRAFVEQGLGSGWYRTREEIGAYFAGLEMVPPGLVELEDWWPSGPPLRGRFPEERVMLGGVGLKTRHEYGGLQVMTGGARD
ncbi:SAM-dependent methyltransferase [Nocardia abscessus]|uniref:SAM-dependent methyltransferase n=1 Tax=Nocardia abscessus TaxID=120957 RepID=UPI002455E290|nr:SAM-dependent methyltransferase [Nocardia abscessus]